MIDPCANINQRCFLNLENWNHEHALNYNGETQKDLQAQKCFFESWIHNYLLQFLNLAVVMSGLHCFSHSSMQKRRSFKLKLLALSSFSSSTLGIIATLHTWKNATSVFLFFFFKKSIVRGLCCHYYIILKLKQSVISERLGSINLSVGQKSDVSVMSHLFILKYTY